MLGRRAEGKRRGHEALPVAAAAAEEVSAVPGADGCSACAHGGAQPPVLCRVHCVHAGHAATLGNGTPERISGHAAVHSTRRSTDLQVGGMEA